MRMAMSQRQVSDECVSNLGYFAKQAHGYDFAAHTPTWNKEILP